MAAVSKHFTHVESIDLLNFTDPKFSQSQYILTSPRSLKACNNLGIKPLELLPASFEDHCKINRLPPSESRRLCAERESRRCEKLARALSERERIIKDHPSGHLPSHSSAHLSGNPGSYSEQPAHRREVDVNLQMKRYTNSCHPSKRRSTILSSKKHKSHLNPHLRENERILKALARKMKEKEEQERRHDQAQQAWLEEAERRETDTQNQLKDHQAQVALQRHLDRLKLEETRRQHVIQEKASKYKSEMVHKSAHQQWEERARRQRELKKDQFAAQKMDKEKKILQQKWKCSIISASRKQEQEELQQHIEQSMEQAANNRQEMERRALIKRKVKSATEQALATARVKAIAEERRKEQQLLDKAIKAKTDIVNNNYSAQVKLRENLIKQSKATEYTEQVQTNLCKLQEEEEERKEGTKTRNAMRMQKADRVSSINKEMKSAKARLMREAKKQEQMMKLSHLKAQEGEELEQAKKDLELKAKHSEDLLKKKLMLIQSSREYAEANTRLRQQMTEKLSKRTFDKMAKEAELRVALENKTSTQRLPPKVLIA